MANNDFMSKYYELGESLRNLEGCKDIIQINVETTLEMANDIDNEGRKLRFLGRHYLDLVKQLKEAGIIN